MCSGKFRKGSVGLRCSARCSVSLVGATRPPTSFLSAPPCVSRAHRPRGHSAGCTAQGAVRISHLTTNLDF